MNNKLTLHGESIIARKNPREFTTDKNSSPFILFICFLLVSLFIQPCPGADWPNWRGPEYTGISQETDLNFSWPETGPKQLWKAEVGIGVSSVVVSKGRLYTMGNIQDTDFVHCLNEQTGEPIWKYSYPSPLNAVLYEGGPTATPLVHGEHLYTLGREGDLYCFNKMTGGIIWQRNLKTEFKIGPPQFGFTGSPQVIGDLLILNAGTSGIAFHKDSGQVAWETGKDPTGYASPQPFVFEGIPSVTIAAKSSVVALQAVNGKKLWEIPWETPHDINAADPIIIDNKMFICSGYGKGCALYDISQEQPVELWKNRNMRNQFSTCIVLDNHIYGFDGNIGGSGANWEAGRYFLRCLDFKTGELKWSHQGLPLGSLTMADGKLILLTVDGLLIIASASPEKYQELARAKLLSPYCWTAPVLANGKLFVRNAPGQLICLDVTDK